MGYVEDLLKKNFVEYASYVVIDRAIPDLIDGFKPVQRRIIHSLLEMDDGNFHKVANVVGYAMRYHPHGDSSIGGALVNLANCDLFIEKQGNFGNFMTGDPAAAPRYIECRLFPFARKVLYNPELTEYVDSYDGRNKEPVCFPAKIPVVVIQGASGIAVTMSTTIFPHNAFETLDAMKKHLRGEDFRLYPDFPGGGIIDVKDYDDGKGSVLVRAKLNTDDPKKIIIEELPYQVTSEAMIASIEKAAKAGKLKIQSINDYTSEKVNIEINLARNTYSKDIVDALYAYTACEQKISGNPLVINNKFPQIMGISEMVKFHAEHLVKVLTDELNLEKSHLLDKLHLRTIERIFIEERIYKKIENKKTAEDVSRAVVKGFVPFRDQLLRDITDEDVERLLKIPIRRISLFDIEKNREEIQQINDAIDLVEKRLGNIVEYSISYIDDMKGMLDPEVHKRKSRIKDFEFVTVKEVAQRNLDVRYDKKSMMLGFDVKTGDVMCTVSEFDTLLVVRKNGTFRFCKPMDKEYVATGLLYCALIEDKEKLPDTIFTLILNMNKSLYIKRCTIPRFQMNMEYTFLPDSGNYKITKFSVEDEAEIMVNYNKSPGRKILEESFYFSDYKPKNFRGTLPVRLTYKDIAKVRIKTLKNGAAKKNTEPSLFGEE